MKIVELFKFPSLFINQFYPRPGTPAARMKRINTAIVSRSAIYNMNYCIYRSYLSTVNVIRPDRIDSDLKLTLSMSVLYLKANKTI